MIHALGYCHDTLKLADPGRLCRGRERWIQPWEQDESRVVHRLVISGASFTDDSARDAVRGINHSKVNLAKIIHLLFPKQKLFAFVEDGHPADIPDEADSIEVYVAYRAGGQQSEPMVRWRKTVGTLEEIDELIGDDVEIERVRGFAVLNKATDLTALSEAIYELTGMSTIDSPPARFQPAALGEVLESVSAVVLLHRDKHGPSLGIYSTEELDSGERMGPLCDETETLLVPFAIPPMLARWDRALAEMKAKWEQEKDVPFPVPESGEPSRWDSRGRRRNRKRGRGKKKSTDEVAQAAPDQAQADDSARPPEGEAPAEDSSPPQVEEVPATSESTPTEE